MMWGYYDNNGGMAVWAILSSLFWLILAGVAVWALIQWLGRASHRTPAPPFPPEAPRQPSPLDVLKARYARGEIDTATFQAMREQLADPADTSQQPRELLPSGR